MDYYNKKELEYQEAHTLVLFDVKSFEPCFVHRLNIPHMSNKDIQEALQNIQILI